MSYTVIELFAGAGGLALGLEKSGLKTILLNEIDKDCVATLTKNRPNWNIIKDDIKNIDFTNIKADVVSGGFPCQAFSYSGKKLGFKDVRGTLFFEFARCVKEVKPKIFLAENVAGLKSHDKGKTLNTMIILLKKLGYDVKYKILNSANYLVPQKRKRLIIIGTLPGITFNFPKEQEKKITLKDSLKNVPHSKGVSYSTSRKRILDLIPPGGNWTNLSEKLQKEFLGKSYYSGGGKRGMARRLSWNELSLTLTTSPSQKQTERCHPEETRPFTIREYARIQTFPDNWNFEGSVSSQYKQIGNAVPVKLAEFLGYELINSLNKKIK
jgi:DNA (cytosine-5)-methyltransferase 1